MEDAKGLVLGHPVAILAPTALSACAAGRIAGWPAGILILNHLHVFGFPLCRFPPNGRR